MMNISFIVYSVLIFTVNTMFATEERTMDNIIQDEHFKWVAQWIGPQSNSQLPGNLSKNNNQNDLWENSWFCFRKSFLLDKNPSSVTAKIAVDSKYWLWINGQLIVFEGGLKRGPTPHDTYYDEIDLSNHIVQGKNTIAVLLWYWGKHGFSHNSSGIPAMVCQVDGAGKIISSDQSWKYCRHPAYGGTKEPHPNYRLPESNILFDAREDMTDWHLPEFDDQHWAHSIELGSPPVSPWHHLHKRPIPFWKISSLTNYVKVDELKQPNGVRFIKATLPHNIQLTPYLKIKAPAGLKIDIHTDTYDLGPNLRAEYVTREGVQEYESLGWLSGHEVIYTVPEEVKILDLKYRQSGYDTNFNGDFQCDDPFYNVLWQKARRTLYVSMRDTYMDCPERERAQWWGDVVNQLGQTFYAFDKKSHQLIKKGILELVHWQRKDNVLFSPIPSGNWDKELPAQMLASISRYGFWSYYKYTGDGETIRHIYPYACNYLNLWEIGVDGLVVYREGDWEWLDWGDDIDKHLVLNCWYYMALDAAVEMAEILGETREISEFQKKMISISQNLQQRCWTGKEYRSPGYQDKTDDRGNALAVIAGIAEPSQWEYISKVLNTQYHASPYMEKYVLEALFMINRPEIAMQRMKKRYATMVESDITTLWEYWQRQFDEFTASYNHSWSGGPLILLSQYVAGVSPEKPGFSTYQVLPQLGPLKNVKAIVPTVKGEIHVTIINEKKI